ncbi:MAG TPA: hypothetical protein VMI53_11675 [Opitutaceae bacterium]|nr:hypothetical protein [Opitutaceae bacterium]
MSSASIALVGDYSSDNIAHRCIPRALELAASATSSAVEWQWVPTSDIQTATSDLGNFSAIWVVPGSPYASMAGALMAIRFARETRRPFLGTCGGFQHALIEFARNVCGIAAADHAETNPTAGRALVITPLSHPLIEKNCGFELAPGSQLQEIYGRETAHESYRCSYGLTPAWRGRLESGGLRFDAFDPAGEPHAFELPTHPFFFGTLFQPERSAQLKEPHPLIIALLCAIAARSQSKAPFE